MSGKPASRRFAMACRKPARRRFVFALLLVSLCAACSSGAAAPPPQQLTLWSGIAPAFTSDLIQRFNKAVPQAQIDLQPTSGGVVAVSAVDAGQGQLGLAQSDVVYLAYRRGIEDNKYPHTNLRAIAVLWVNTFHMLVRRDSPFQSIADLKGRRVGIIPKGTSGEFSTRIVLAAYGMNSDDVQAIFQPTDSLVPKLGSGQIDAVFSANPLMPATAIALSHTVPLRLLPIGRREVNRLRGSYPFLRPVTVAGNQLRGQNQPIETLGAEWLLVCRSDLSEDLVYQLTRAFFDQLPALARDHGEAALIDPEQAPAAPIPLHAGAARYYREREILR
ncbi:MAG TPA: TAXI family TRAP transporter solute-binding subunit [Vicinamibacterales bacterium]|nr:TAXI family TRAP transporter solute-binding subunit [Vicinamibacterales bacterium]